MRTLLVVVLMVASCATAGDVNESLRAANWCEQTYPGQCATYWQRVQSDQNSYQAGQNLAATAQAYQAANAATPPVNPYAATRAASGQTSCTTRTRGNTAYTDCY